jgi:hypothetical protein
VPGDEPMKFLIRLWKGDWQPCDIFYEIEYHGIEVGVGIFGVYSFDVRTSKLYTPLGSWFEAHAAIFHLIKLPYYLITWPLYFALQSVHVTLELFYKPL